MWNLLQNIMPTTKPDVKILANSFLVIINLDFKFNIVQVSLKRLTTPFSKT